MSRPAGKLYHPETKEPTDIFEGFSWPCFFFGGFWYLVKGMVVWGLLALVAVGATFGLATIAFAFLANKQRVDFLLKKGYLTEEQMNQGKREEAVAT